MASSDNQEKQLKIKTLDQKIIPLKAFTSETILDVKQKIEKAEGHDPSLQKLILKGKILDDGKTLRDYEDYFSEKDFFVLMVSKPKKAKPAAEEASSKKGEDTSPSAAQASATTELTEAKKEQQTEPEKMETETEPSAQAPTAGNDSIVTGSELEKVIQNLMEMGFERDQVRHALQAAYNNPDRAAEYLFHGMPEVTEEQPINTQPEAHANSARTPSDDQPPELENIDPTTIGAQLQQAAGENPAALLPILRRMGFNNPEALQRYQQDPEGFIKALAEEISGEGGEGGEGGVSREPQVIQVTQAEKEAIDRLEGMGFKRARAIEAYFACDKNEELAANYLLERGTEDD